jgi:hypothetical protein
MVSSSYSTSGTGRVTLVMGTAPTLLVTEVVLFLLWKVIPALLVTEVVLFLNNTTSVTSRVGAVPITRVTRPVPLVE